MRYTAIKDKTSNQWVIVDDFGNPTESVPTFESVVDALKYINENLKPGKEKVLQFKY